MKIGDILVDTGTEDPYSKNGHTLTSNLRSKHLLIYHKIFTTDEQFKLLFYTKLL